jgi:hypothetical protein
MRGGERTARGDVVFARESILEKMGFYVKKL